MELGTSAGVANFCCCTLLFLLLFGGPRLKKGGQKPQALKCHVPCASLGGGLGLN